MKIDYSNLIRMKLLREMKTGEFSKCDRLPRELELAKQFNVSRNHLREVLAQLEREGFVTRIHGVGTIINHHVMQVKNRMDIEVEFLDIIRQNGYQPDISHVHIQEEEADSYIAKNFKYRKKRRLYECAVFVQRMEGRQYIVRIYSKKV